MSEFRPFQFLYNVFKNTDQRLFDVLERIHGNLEELFDMTDNQVIQKSGIDNLTLASFYQDVPGLSVTLRKPGTWLICVNLECKHVSPDTTIEFCVVANGITLGNTGITFNDSGILIVSCAKFWVYKAIIKPPNTSLIRIRAKGGGGSEIKGLNSEIIATWMNTDV